MGCCELYRLAEGRVSASWEPVGGGDPVQFVGAHNTMTYSAADAIAAAYGGDTRGIPAYIGFLYGTVENPSLPPVTRDFSFSDLTRLASDHRLNLQVARFSRRPSTCVYADGADSTDSVDSEHGTPYRANTVEFHAVTRSGVNGVYPLGSATGAGFLEDQFDSGKYAYRAVLLGDGADRCDGGDRYVVLAVVDLAVRSVGGLPFYRSKPEQYELALDWRVTFE